MSIESRLASLERSNRQLKFLCAALCLALAGVFVIAADKPGDAVADVVRAKKIEVVGSKGDVIEMGELKDGGLITAYDQKGREVARLGALNGGGTVSVRSYFDDPGHSDGQVAVMSCDRGLGPRVYFFGFSDKDVTRETVDLSNANLSFNEDDGTPIVLLNAIRIGGVGLHVFDKGKEVWRSGSHP